MTAVLELCLDLLAPQFQQPEFMLRCLGQGFVVFRLFPFRQAALRQGAEFPAQHLCPSLIYRASAAELLELRQRLVLPTSQGFKLAPCGSLCRF
ncbi:MAG: hypothetical protein LW645_08565 [Verrucomicrobiaceae bacterium]|nr:hypothetical protein [Verrucomicrobiaceae bacterium]